MRKRSTITLTRRAGSMLCCAGAILLSACGGAADETDPQQSLGAMASASPASMAGAAATGPGATAVARVVTDAGAADPGAQPALAAPPALEAPPALAAPPATLPDAATVAAGAGPTPADTTVVSDTPMYAGEGSAAPASGEFSLSGYQQGAAAAALGPGAAVAPDGGSSPVANQALPTN